MTIARIITAKNASGLPAGPDFDYFVLAGDKSPGKATLISCDAVQGWDIQKGNGLSWATVVPTGEELSEIVFEIEIWSGDAGLEQDDQYAAWLQFAAQYLSRPLLLTAGSTTPKAIGFWHGLASAPPYYIDAVVVRKVTAMKYREGTDSYVAEVTFLEWRPPQPAPPRTDQKTPAAETNRPTAKDALDQAQLDATDDMNASAARAAGYDW